MLLERRELFSPEDHQTHRRYAFDVPRGCAQLRIHVRYSPKFLSAVESNRLVRQAVTAQVHSFRERIGAQVAQRWAADFDSAELIIPNLVTISVDDAAGVYRGAGHRQNQDQSLTLGLDEASPGLVAGPLPQGEWTLTLTAHTIVSTQCEVRIQIGAVMAVNTP